MASSASRNLISSMTSAAAALATGSCHYSSLDEKIAKMRKRKADDDDDDDGDDRMDVDEYSDEDAASSDKHQFEQGILT